MEVELYVAYMNHTWDTFIVSVDDNVESIEEEALKIGQKELFNNPNTKDEVAFIGIYHY